MIADASRVLCAAKSLGGMSLAAGLLLGVLGSAVDGCAQESIRYVPVEGVIPEPLDSPARPDVRFRTAEVRLTGGAWDPAVEALLRGAEKYAKSVFNVPSLRFQRAAVERVASGPQRGDVLIAEWGIEEPFGSGVLILTDTPYYANYGLRLSECQIGSRTEVTAFLRALLAALKNVPKPSSNVVVDSSPLFTVRLAAAPALIKSFGGMRRPYSPIDRIADFYFYALLEDGNWYLDFAVGKSGTQEYYGVPAWIPERFPPLSELARSWSADRLRREVGVTVKPFDGVPAFTADRDRILVAELARRGLSQSQVVDLLADVDRTEDAYSSRLGTVLWAFDDAVGKGSFVRAFFNPALETYSHVGPLANKSVWSLFAEAANQCSSGFEIQALDTLKGGVFLEGPLNYLGRCSNSVSAIQVLERLSVRAASLENMRSVAVRDIRRRIDDARRASKTPGRESPVLPR